MKARVWATALCVMAAPATAGMRTVGDRQAMPTLLLSSDRSSYYIGEPVRLTLTVKNDSDHAINGYFSLGQEDRITIHYRGAGEPFRPARRRPDTVHDAVPIPSILRSSEQRQSTATILVDQSAMRLLLDQPGEYEFLVEARPSLTDRGQVVRSETIRIAMSPPPGAHRAAFEDYVARGLVRLVAGVVPLSDAEASRSALAFLDRHPSGPYSDEVRAGLVTFLDGRMVRHLATPEEEELYGRLRGEQTRPGSQ